MKPQHIKNRGRGFKRASSLMETSLRKAGETRGFAVTRLLTRWPEIVGADIAQMCTPIKVNYAKGGLGGTLVVLTTGPMAQMLEMQLPMIQDRVNACYGYNAIARIKITQTAPTGFREGQATFMHQTKSDRAPNPAQREQAMAVADAVEDSELKQALAQLGANILNGKKTRS